MAITFLHPDLEQQPCGVTVGVVAGAFDIEQVAESFRGRVDIRSISEPIRTQGYEVVFRQSESPQEVEVLLPLNDDRSRGQPIVVSVADSPFPVLDSVAYAVLAPAFVPGGVGIDWDDLCMILRSGNRAILVVTESSEAAVQALGTLESLLATCDPNRISGVVAASFVPRGRRWVADAQALGESIGRLAPNAMRLHSVPFIEGDTAVCAMLVVIGD